MISEQVEIDKSKEQKAAKFKDEDFELYKAFYQAPGADAESLKKYKHSALLYIFIILWRRIVLLYTAMFLTNYAWI